jgi:glycosyltransferase involved in cell wall biosynthesis
MDKLSTANRRRKMIVLGQTPPPLHGQAVAIKLMLDGLSETLDIVHVPMRFSEKVYENGRLSPKKVTHLLGIIFRSLLLLLRYPGSILYYPPAPATWVPVIRDLIILTILRPFSGKTVFHFHAHGLGSFLNNHWWLNRFTWAWRKPDLAIVIGNSCIDDVQHIKPRNISVVPYGTSFSHVVRDRTDNQKLRVLYVGMLSESKGIFDLLETAATLRDLDIEFRLAGTYKYTGTEQQFEKRLSELELRDSVRLLGQQSGNDLWQEYSNADIFFFPTYFESETFGLVVLEAMSQALPVVASNWRGPCDIVQDGETGYLCQPRCVPAYSAAIRKLAEDSALRQRMGFAGRNLCNQSFSVSRYLGTLESLFVQLGCNHKNKAQSG